MPFFSQNHDKSTDSTQNSGEKVKQIAKASGEKVAEIVKAGSEKAVEIAKAGTAKAKQLAEIAKLKADNLSQEEAIRKAYQELGKLYYELYNAQAEGEYAQHCTAINEAKATIESNNAKIEELKTQEKDEKTAPVKDEQNLNKEFLVALDQAEAVAEQGIFEI